MSSPTSLQVAVKSVRKWVLHQKPHCGCFGCQQIPMITSSLCGLLHLCKHLPFKLRTVLKTQAVQHKLEMKNNKQKQSPLIVNVVPVLQRAHLKRCNFYFLLNTQYSVCY